MTLNDTETLPLENVLADFIQRELALVGVLHSALAVLRVAADLGALSGEEMEALDNAAADILTLHGYCLKRSEVRRSMLANLQNVMLMESGQVAEILHFPEGAKDDEMRALGFVPVDLSDETPIKEEPLA